MNIPVSHAEELALTIAFYAFAATLGGCVLALLLEKVCGDNLAIPAVPFVVAALALPVFLASLFATLLIPGELDSPTREQAAGPIKETYGLTQIDDETYVTDDGKAVTDCHLTNVKRSSTYVLVCGGKEYPRLDRGR